MEALTSDSTLIKAVEVAITTVILEQMVDAALGNASVSIIMLDYASNLLCHLLCPCMLCR